MTQKRFNFALVACARWETGYLTEWLGYHRSIGCGHVWLYCNDDDPTNLYAEVMPFLSGPEPFVTFIHFPFIGQQRQMYLHFLRNHAQNAEWIAFIDIDEFIWLPRDRTIDHFIAEFDENWQAIALNWVMFGPSAYAVRPPGSVLLNYRRRSVDPDPYTKTLICVAAIPAGFACSNPQTDFWHFWHLPGIACCNVLGESMDGYYADFPHHAHRFIHDDQRDTRLIEAGAIAHFPFKAEADFARRASRGLDGDFAGQAQWGALAIAGGIAEFVSRLNAYEENRLADYWTAQLARGWGHGILPRPIFPNIAPIGVARQSSTAIVSDGATSCSAQAAISGRPAGKLQCRTEVESAPWWEVTFQAPICLHELRLFDVPDATRQRYMPLQIEAWLPETGYSTIYRNPAQSPFGGVDGTPLCIAFDPVVGAQRIKIETFGMRALGFDQVEVYGQLDYPNRVLP